MSRATFKTNRGEFGRRHNAFIDMVLGHMSLDIEVALKRTAGMPVDKGQMKAATRSFRNTNNQHRVEINKEYAEYQERGARRDGTHVVKNYTTSGTSSGFFRRAIEMVWKNQLSYVTEARRALNL